MTPDAVTFADTIQPRARRNAGRFSWRGNMLEGLVMWCLSSLGVGSLFAALCWHELTPSAREVARQKAADDFAEYLRSVLPAKFVETTHNGAVQHD